MICHICGKENCMSISPEYCVNKWWEIQKRLLIDKNTPEWSIAIDILDNRIQNRFLKQIKYLAESEDQIMKVYSGFAIMSIDCLLVETLNQFYLGIEDTNKAYKTENWKTFKDFFKGSSHFANAFSDTFTGDKDEKSKSKSGLFYHHIRCGLLHQAETKMNSKVKFKKLKMITYIDDKYPENGIEVDRQLFHEALVKEFEDYKKRLMDTKQQILRQHFIKKMNLICRVEKIFCYGSNMLTKRLLNRVTNAIKIGVAKLPDYAITFNKKSKDGSGKANLIKSANSVVLGVVFELPPLQQYELNKCEVGYKVDSKEVEYADGRKELVSLYIATDDLDNSLSPYDWYKQYIIKGANEHNLPNNYITDLQSINMVVDDDQVRSQKNWEVLNK